MIKNIPSSILPDHKKQHRIHLDFIYFIKLVNRDRGIYTGTTHVRSSNTYII